jgi:7-cyano-7-deazaguanine synthase
MTLDSDPPPPADALEKPRAVVLLSGGLDSATCLAIAREAGFAAYTLAFHYGQRHQIELARAAEVAARGGSEAHRVVDIDLSQFGGSALTTSLAVPKHDSVDAIGAEIPITYVPARNTVFLSLALAWAEVLGARDLFIGVNALDYSGYPDCRPEFIDAFAKLANLATKASVTDARPMRVHAPLLHLRKGQIIRRGLELGVDYRLTSSCYDPDPTGRACGRCDSCLLRLQGFADAGYPDPIGYVGR